MALSDIGNLMCLPIDEIEPGIPTDAHQYLISSAAKYLIDSGRNWLPLVVKEIALDRYQVIGNSFIYAVALESGIPEVWCIIADDQPSTEKSTQVLAQEFIPKTNLSTASREEIAAALSYLTQQPNSPLKGINLGITVERIDSAPRRYWKNFSPIKTLGCRITESKKLKALEQVFYLTPEAIPDVIEEQSLLERLTISELRKQAKKRAIKGFSKMNKEKLVSLLSSKQL